MRAWSWQMPAVTSCHSMRLMPAATAASASPALMPADGVATCQPFAKDVSGSQVSTSEADLRRCLATLRQTSRSCAPAACAAVPDSLEAR